MSKFLELRHGGNPQLSNDTPHQYVGFNMAIEFALEHFEVVSAF